MATIRLIQPGQAKPNNNPYTLCIVANPVLEDPAGQLSPDPITGSEPTFDRMVQYVCDCLFGRLPQQREQSLAAIAPDVRIISIFDAALEVDQPNSLVQEDSDSDVVVPSLGRFAPFLAQYAAPGVNRVVADVCFAITDSQRYTRSSAYHTTDLPGSAGIAFAMDNKNLSHSYLNQEPGQVALHTSADSVVAIHEFGHAASSFSNGNVVDQYVDTVRGINKKSLRPIPGIFGNYVGWACPSDTTRGNIGYPAGWTTYHPERTNSQFPSLMDDFYQSLGGPEACEFDQLTRRFLLDRIGAIMSRP